MSRSTLELEPKRDGEIAIRRLPDEGGQATAQPATSADQLRSPAALLSRRATAPVQVADFKRVEDYLRAYLEDERFRPIHPVACGRWIVAWEMLWCADSRAKVIAVGQRAHDAMRAFAASLLERCPAFAMDPDWPSLITGSPGQPHALDRLSGLIGAYHEQLGEQRSELLHALIAHWCALHETLRRHADGERPAVGRLRWEDGRRLVLFTALVMVEIDRSFA